MARAQSLVEDERPVVRVRLEERRVWAVTVQRAPAFVVKSKIAVYRLLHIMRQRPDLLPPPFDLTLQNPMPLARRDRRAPQRADLRQPQRQSQHDEQHRVVSGPLRLRLVW